MHTTVLDTEARAAGILLPVSSLPSPHGIGSFGHAAREWVDFLAAAGQRCWQVLPLGPTSYGDSPYQSLSSFAGNPYYIDLDELCAEGLLHPAEVQAVCGQKSAGDVDYGALFVERPQLLRLAFSRFEGREALAAFRRKHAAWLEQYALYMALKEHNGHRAWWEWPMPLRNAQPQALAEAKKQLARQVEYQVFVQYLFFTQWERLKRYANSRGVAIMGDIPIYVAMDSADTWAESGLFLLDGQRRPIEVAGCPPDAFSVTGQLWGNPLYRWDTMREDGYAWWMRRLAASLEMYDMLRIDHFRGLAQYYAIPYGDATAERGTWRKGPGYDFIATVNRHFPGAYIVAEDLGFLTEDVRELLRRSGYPGMKVLQFAFDSREASDYMPYNYEKNSVVYTGTHDNDTVRGWLSTADPGDLALALRYFGCESSKKAHWGFIRAALLSPSKLAVIPIQDYLNLPSEGRINIPSTLGGNWCWRLAPGQVDAALARQLRSLAEIAGRTDSTSRMGTETVDLPA